MPLGLTRHRPGDLPVEVTEFVGRRRELATLVGLLRTARLVTVIGPGGVGKTRIALRAAAQLAGEFADGACLVELSGLHDPELLPDTAATSLGLNGAESGSRLDAILDHLRDRRLLLILDTCEHLVDACAMFAEVLLRATQITVLATSRQPLTVPGEHTCVIPPLPVPDLRARTVGDGDAVELFARCAAAVVPGFAVTDTNRATVINLCRRLDGVPLAIELATVRLRAIRLEQLADRLEDRFRLRQLRLEHADLRAALEYALAAPGGERDAAAMAISLDAYWQMSSAPGEGRHWLGKILPRLGARSRARALALIVDGYLACLQDDAASGLTALEDGIALAQERGDERIRARGYLNLTMALAFAGRYEDAARAGVTAYEAALAAGDTSMLIVLDSHVGYLHMLAGQVDEGLARCRSGLDRLGPDSAERFTRAAWLLGAADTRWHLVGGRLGRNATAEALHAPPSGSSSPNAPSTPTSSTSTASSASPRASS
jgi:predicted ATPase